MHEVIGIEFESGNRMYYFSKNNLDIKKGDKLVVETERGLQYCTAVTDIVELPDSKVVTPLRPIIRIATKDDIDCLLSIRLEMLTVVNNLPENYEHSDEVINESRDYFLNGDQMTVLASDGDKVIGCASMSFIRIMPTFAHPTGKRAHLMNVYTRSEYRRQGIARKMVEMLIEKTWEKGATEISLDATAMGRPLYESMGFTDSTECMVLTNL